MSVVLPCHHWVFLAEIIEDTTLRIPGMTMIKGGKSKFSGIGRPRYIVRDRSGREIPVAFYLDSDEEFNHKKYVVGHTFAGLYAEQHGFLDLTTGIRIESLTFVKVRSLL
jgi:hypothetical protein